MRSSSDQNRGTIYYLVYSSLSRCVSHYISLHYGKSVQRLSMVIVSPADENAENNSVGSTECSCIMNHDPFILGITIMSNSSISFALNMSFCAKTKHCRMSWVVEMLSIVLMSIVTAAPKPYSCYLRIPTNGHEAYIEAHCVHHFCKQMPWFDMWHLLTIQFIYRSNMWEPKDNVLNCDPFKIYEVSPTWIHESLRGVYSVL